VPSLPSNYFEAMKKMEGEKNKIISLYTEIDEIKSARIRKLEHDLDQEIERSQNFVKKMQQMKEDLLKRLNEQVRGLNEHLDTRLELIMVLKHTISEQKLIIHLLKEQVASLEEENH
jgi:hypothetical protein